MKKPVLDFGGNDPFIVLDGTNLVDGAQRLKAGLFELGMHLRHETFGDRNPVERSFQEVKRRTDHFYNCFPQAEPETAEAWLQALTGAQ